VSCDIVEMCDHGLHSCACICRCHASTWPCLCAREHQAAWCCSGSNVWREGDSVSAALCVRTAPHQSAGHLLQGVSFSHAGIAGPLKVAARRGALRTLRRWPSMPWYATARLSPARLVLPPCLVALATAHLVGCIARNSALWLHSLPPLGRGPCSQRWRQQWPAVACVAGPSCRGIQFVAAVESEARGGRVQGASNRTWGHVFFPLPYLLPRGVQQQ
jgi:hypothetical protein